VRKKTSAQTEKMLDAAGRLFGAQRFHEVRMEDIAAEAEVGKGTLYRYFNDKEELYLSLLERSSRELLNRLQEERLRFDSPSEQLSAFVASIVAFFDEQPHVFDLIQRADVMLPPDRNSPWQSTRDAVLRELLELFKEAQARGEFVIRDPELSGLLLLGGLRSVIRFGHKPRPSDLGERIVQSFLQGADLSQHKPAQGPSLVTEPSRV